MARIKHKPLNKVWLASLMTATDAMERAAWTEAEVDQGRRAIMLAELKRELIASRDRRLEAMQSNGCLNYFLLAAERRRIDGVIEDALRGTQVIWEDSAREPLH